MLSWMDRLLAWQVEVTRYTHGELADDPYRGLAIHLPDAPDAQNLAAELPPELLAERAQLLEERIALEKHFANPEDSKLSPLLWISQVFDLSPFERDILLLALLPEIDLNYERVFGYIQNSVIKTRPGIDLALHLLCPEPDRRLQARAAFMPGGALLKHRLIELLDDGQTHPPLPGRAIKLDARIVEELLNWWQNNLASAPIDDYIARFVTLSWPQRQFATLVLPETFVAQLRDALKGRGHGLVLALSGRYGSGRRAIAEALCSEAQLPLLTVDIDRLIRSNLEPQESAQRILREANLHTAALFYQQSDELLHNELFHAWQLALIAALDAYRECAFLAVEHPWLPRGLLRHSTYIPVELPTLAYSAREQIWQQRLSDIRHDDSALKALASTFRLNGGQIRDAVAMARSLAHWQMRNGSGQVSASILYAACRAQSSGRLNSLANKVAPTYCWDDIVLPAESVAQLREICVQVRHRRTVLESWGFDRSMAMGKGINVLFAGSSGTGKTMAAEIIAADLGLELYRVNLSSLVSKYIGETEKNLERIFVAAREANAILFFDEADSIFGKRSEVKDAHDRYANIEVGYLLQQMEQYDGVVILATNLRKNIDDAFIRRLHLVIEFPFPDEDYRLHIWQKVFPPEAPLQPDIDLQFVARQFKLSGGNIRNIALLAAFLAAEDGQAIGMIHIVRALKREYQKLGKLIVAADFGAYMPLVRQSSPDADGQHL